MGFIAAVFAHDFGDPCIEVSVVIEIPFVLIVLWAVEILTSIRCVWPQSDLPKYLHPKGIIFGNLVAVGTAASDAYRYCIVVAVVGVVGPCRRLPADMLMIQTESFVLQRLR